MKIISSSIVYRFYTTCLFVILINIINIGNTFADTKTDNNTDSGVILELSTNATNDNKKTPIWDGYDSQTSSDNPDKVANRKGYEKPIATIVPNTKSVTQGDIIYFRLQYENAGASFYWIMGDQRSADRTLRIDTSTLTLGKHRVRVSVTNKARQQASSQAFFEVFANSTDRVSLSEAISDTEQDQDTPVDYQGNAIESTANDSSKNSPAMADEETNNVTIVPAILSVDQGEIASFKSNTTLSDEHDFHWRFGTQLADLDKFQISTKDVIPGTYKVYLRITNKDGNEKNITAQLIVKDPNIEKINVPNLVGKNIEEANHELESVELVKGMVEEKEASENQGKIIAQFPEAGTEVNINNKIDLVVGINAAIDVPNVIGKDVENAKSLLDQNSFRIIVEKKVSDEKEGKVLTQSPTAGTTLKQGEAVKLVIAEAAVEKEEEEEEEAEETNDLVDVAIKTTAASVEQGTEVVFSAVLKNTKDDENYTYLWEFGIQKSTKHSFTVNTDELALGKHTIKLHVKDGKDKTITRETGLEIRAKRLLVPTLTNLSPEEARKAIKKAGLLLGTIKREQGNVENARVKQQSPAFGEYVSHDQPINLVIIIPEEDKETEKAEKNDPARVDIRFDKTSGKAGEAIVFTTKVTTKTTLSDIHYVYSINNIKKASVDTRFTWVPEVEGIYTVSVTAYNEGGAIAKSESYNLDIEAGWEKPIAKLLPEKIKLNQGDIAEFSSNSTYDLKSTLVYEWISSSGHSGNQKGFAIDTTRLDAGKYDVTLTITDDKGSKSTATAQLILQEVLESTNNIDKPSKEKDIVQFSADSKEKEKLAIILNTSSRVIQVGKKIQFNMQVTPQASPEALYYYQLGDKKRRQWMNTATFEHHYNSIGSYSVRAVIKQNDEVYYSDSVTIWVWSAWLLGLIGGIGFFLFALIWWWTKRSHPSDVNNYNKESFYEENNNNNNKAKAKAIEEQIPLSQAQGKYDVAYDIVTEKREQGSVKSVLIKGIIQFILGILLSFIILYIILKLMGLV